MPSALPDHYRQLLRGLPDPFVAADVRAAAARAGLAPRTAEAVVRALARRGVVTRVRRGVYAHLPVPAAEPFRLPRAVVPQRIPENVAPDSPALLFNRELSWIDFNWRVLAQALDPRLPLAERVRFVGIAANNLDEFVRKRVGGLRRQLAAGVTGLSPDGRTPAQQVRMVRDALAPMWATLHDTWEETLRPELAAAGTRICSVDSLAPDERAALDDHFERNLFPLLTPLAVDQGHPFPFISNHSLSLAVLLRRPGRETEHFARLKVPLGRGRFVAVPGASGGLVPVEDVIRVNVGRLFQGMEIEGAWAFRVTRNANVDRSEDEAEDLLAMISEELRERRFAEAVRLEVDAEMPERVQTLLARELELDPADVWPAWGLLDLTGLIELATRATRAPRDDSGPRLAFEPWTGVVPRALRPAGGEAGTSGALFETIRTRDVLLFHPYESFRTSVQRFIEEAADDPAVLAIKLTLYRTSDDSPVVQALVRAAERGKQVAALIEVTARFDEANNIEWARVLEEAGAHVAYGLPGLKTHAKTALVVRDEGGTLQTYAHVGTGNYNPSTARLYTDLGLLTADPDIGRDLAQLFHVLTGYSSGARYRHLLVAPDGLRTRFAALIRREADEARAGRRGRIVAKMNALDDTDVIEELYAASQAGVEIDLVVRGHCRLRPGVPGVSETIRVRSLVGRFLEHDRIYWFGAGGTPEVFIGSADWQRRNLDDRVEVVVPVRDPGHRATLRAVLRSCLDDDALAWRLDDDGHYTRVTPGRRPHDHQQTMMRWARNGGPPRAALTAEL